jgi:hypothetical protein
MCCLQITIIVGTLGTQVWLSRVQVLVAQANLLSKGLLLHRTVTNSLLNRRHFSCDIHIAWAITRNAAFDPNDLDNII